MTTDSRLRRHPSPLASFAPRRRRIARGPFRTRPLCFALALLLTTTGGVTLGVGSAAAGKAKSIKTEAKFVSYDAATKKVTVRVQKAGKKPSNAKLRLKTGKEATFNVKPEGSVLTRTSITLNGKRAEISDIPEKKTVNIYWVPDEEHPGERFARKIDMILSDRELAERDDERLEAEKAAGRAADLE